MDTFVIRFDVQVSYRSISNGHNLYSYIYSAWDTPTDRDDYILKLTKESNDIRGIADVRIQFEEYKPGEKKQANTAVIIAVSVLVGSVVAVFLFWFLFKDPIRDCVMGYW